MATQPARSRPPANEPADDQSFKKWMTIFGIAAVVFTGGFFALNALMTEKRGGEGLVDVPHTAPPPPPPPIDNRPVALAARPLRLFNEFVKALSEKDRKAIAMLSDLDDAKLTELVTEDHAKFAMDARVAKRVTMTDQTIADGTARMAAILANGRGREVMGLVLEMRQKGGPEDWTVSRVLTQYYSASGRAAEARPVALGEDRKGALYVAKEVPTFATMPEGEPVALDWLPGTADSQKAEIQRHVADLLDDKNPGKLQAASQALVDIGKNAIPHMLTAFLSLDIARNEVDIRRGNTLDRTLAAMAHQHMGYDVTDVKREDQMPPAAARLRAIRRWFGWWERNKDRPLPTVAPGEGQ